MLLPLAAQYLYGRIMSNFNNKQKAINKHHDMLPSS